MSSEAPTTSPIWGIRISPEHQLIPVGVAATPLTSRLQALLENKQPSEALLALGAAPLPAHAHPSLQFWHELASTWLRALCHLPEAQSLTEETLDPPETRQCVEWVLGRPPMDGAEYLNEALILAIWRQFNAWTVERVNELGGVSSFLQKFAPEWQRIGRISVHLAENKNDPEFPFAFMATYAAGLNTDGKIRRLPLGRALQEFAGAGMKQDLARLLAPLNAAATQSKLIEQLVSSGDVFHPLVWTPAEAFAFLREIPIYESCGLVAQVPNWWRKRRRAKVQVTIGSKKGAGVGMGALLDFSLAVAYEGKTLTPAEIEALLEQTDGLVLLRGEWVEVDREKLQEALIHWHRVEQQAGEGISFADGMRMLAGAAGGLEDEAHLADHVAWTQVEAGDALREVLAALRGPDGLNGEAPKSLQATLRPYQLAGVNWLWLCGQLGLGACLADDMGLGKTIQVLATLLRFKEAGGGAPSLLIVPASLIGNWKEEAQRFAPRLRVLIAHRSESDLAVMDQLADRLPEADLVITTYGMVTRLAVLEEANWSWIILDEAQAIKNPSAQQTRAVKTLQGHARIALTGTPVENRLGDLWSIFDFINPGLLGSAGQFAEFTQALDSRDPIDYNPLRNLTAPYLLRRMKTDPAIVPDLPDKTEVQSFCTLAQPQAVLYQETLAALKRDLADESKSEFERKGLVLNYLMRFKQICNHPSQLLNDGAFAPADSGKFKRLRELCSEIADRGEKVLVFTQYRIICEPLNHFISPLFGREGLVLHGGTPVTQRKNFVSQFQDPQGPSSFVLSIKAGGTGLNLTAAAHVIHFDRWWNPAIENQATDRAYRIGQKRNVLVHKFVTRGTIEEKIDAMIRRKQQTADALLEGDTETVLTELNDEEILDLVALDLSQVSEA